MILVVGINPSSGKPNKTSATIKKLHRWMDTLGYKHFSFTNVIPNPGPYKLNMIDIEEIRNSAQGYDKVIALGPFVSKALQKAYIPHHTLPHPSPLNRQLNDTNYETKRLQECKEYLNG